MKKYFLCQSLFKKGLNLNTLKYIAISAMLLDHIALAFLDSPDTKILFNILDCIGRITAPIMFFAAVEGYHHTKNLKKYLLRLFLLAIISYFPYMYAWSNTFQPFNLSIIFTIFTGILAIHIRRTCKNLFLKILLILLLIFLTIPMDFGTNAILIILAFDFYYGNLKNQLFSYFMISLCGLHVLYYFTFPLWSWYYMDELNLEHFSDFYALGFLLPLILLSLYNGEKGSNSRFSKWIFYVFYTLHLIVIGILWRII